MLLAMFTLHGLINPLSRRTQNAVLWHCAGTRQQHRQMTLSSVATKRKLSTFPLIIVSDFFSSLFSFRIRWTREPLEHKCWVLSNFSIWSTQCCAEIFSATSR